MRMERMQYTQKPFVYIRSNDRRMEKRKLVLIKVDEMNVVALEVGTRGRLLKRIIKYEDMPTRDNGKAGKGAYR